MDLLRRLQNHPHLLERTYQITDWVVKRLEPVIKLLGYRRSNRLIRWAEELTKRAIFDCRMCGQCVLHTSGMTCPMTCPKFIRNGPCGGVRPDGHCEVIPEMMCVWVQAYERSRRMPVFGRDILLLQPPVNHLLEGTSAWINTLTGEDKIAPIGWIQPSDIAVSIDFEPHYLQIMAMQQE